MNETVRSLLRHALDCPEDLARWGVPADALDEGGETLWADTTRKVWAGDLRPGRGEVRRWRFFWAARDVYGETSYSLPRPVIDSMRGAAGYYKNTGLWASYLRNNIVYYTRESYALFGLLLGLRRTSDEQRPSLPRKLPSKKF